MSLEGRLDDLGLTDIFQIISLSKRSGVLTLIRKEGTARLVFSQGFVIFATSDTRNRLGYTLVQKGIISNSDLENALKIQKTRGSSKPIGTILMETCSLDQETLEKEIRGHILYVAMDLMSWTTGSFHFELGSPLEDDIALKVGLNTDFLLLEAARLKDEQARDEAKPKPAAAVEGIESFADINESTLTGQAPGTAALEKKPVPTKNRKDLSLLATMITELSGPSSNSEITLLVLRFASELMNRAVILLARKEDIVGLGQFGLEFPDETAQELVRAIRIPLAEPSVFHDVCEKKVVYKSPLSQSKWHTYFMEAIGKDWPSEVFLAPLVCEKRVIAVLYADNAPGQDGLPETEGLEAFIKVAGVAFGKALLERRLQG